MRFNPPPGWPAPPPGWTPGPDWKPPEGWTYPQGWQFWVNDDHEYANSASGRPPTEETSNRKRWISLGAIAAVVSIFGGSVALWTTLRDELGPPPRAEAQIEEVVVANYGSGEIGINLRIRAVGYRGESIVVLLGHACGYSEEEAKSSFEVAPWGNYVPENDEASEVLDLTARVNGADGMTCLVVSTIATESGKTLDTKAADPFMY